MTGFKITFMNVYDYVLDLKMMRLKHSLIGEDGPKRFWVSCDFSRFLCNDSRRKERNDMMNITAKMKMKMMKGEILV